MYNVVINKVEETNPFFDENKKHNGGGYSQPTIEFSFNGGTGIIEDDSCGEFGSSVVANIFIADKVYSAIYGTMEEEDSNIPDSLKTLVDEIGNVTGYRIPLASDIEELED